MSLWSWLEDLFSGSNPDKRVGRLDEKQGGHNRFAPQYTNGANDLPGRIPTELWHDESRFPSFQDIDDQLQTMNEGLVHTVSENWRHVGQALHNQHNEFLTKVMNVEGWEGEGFKAAQDALVTYSGALKDLSDRALYMQSVMQNAADTVNLSKNAVAEGRETAEFIERQNSLGEYEPQDYDRYKNQVREYAARRMTEIYDPGIQDTAQAAPLFASPSSNPSGAPDSPSISGPGGGSGGGGSGGGVPGGGGGVPSISSTPTSIPGTPSKSGTPTAPKPSNTPSIPSGLSSGLQQAAGLGSQAANQAQSAAQKLASLAKSPLTKPAGLHALDALKKSAGAPAGLAALGKSGGGGKAGGGAGGAAGIGKLGGLSKELSAAEKAALARGAKTVADAERAALSSARGASASGAGPMGAGGAGARGAGGEDKEHKANKYLRTVTNGEALVGAPPAVTAAVIKES